MELLWCIFPGRLNFPLEPILVTVFLMFKSNHLNEKFFIVFYTYLSQCTHKLIVRNTHNSWLIPSRIFVEIILMLIKVPRQSEIFILHDSLIELKDENVLYLHAAVYRLLHKSLMIYCWVYNTALENFKCEVIKEQFFIMGSCYCLPTKLMTVLSL